MSLLPTVLSPSSEHAAVLSSSSAWSSRGSSASQPSAGASDALRLADGQTFGAYTIVQLLGRGGMGVVFKARDTKLHRLVALKMILAGTHAGGQELVRFRNEAEAVARLQHPNIVQVFEVGEHDGQPFFSLELCPGGSLDKTRNGTPLPAAAAAGLVPDPLAAVLRVLHDVEVDAGVDAELLRRFEARRGRADHQHLLGPVVLGDGGAENADGARSLDQHGLVALDGAEAIKAVHGGAIGACRSRRGRHDRRVHGVRRPHEGVRIAPEGGLRAGICARTLVHALWRCRRRWS